MVVADSSHCRRYADAYPLIAGTANFLLSFKGDLGKNLILHCTDFTVAHIHIAMYGIIAFILWVI
jgi:hypothetical protein